jgi:hypothetical protein
MMKLERISLMGYGKTQLYALPVDIGETAPPREETNTEDIPF